VEEEERRSARRHPPFAPFARSSSNNRTYGRGVVHGDVLDSRMYKIADSGMSIT